MRLNFYILVVYTCEVKLAYVYILFYKKARNHLIVSLDHIALLVSLEKSLRFYKKLGFAESKRIERSYDTVVFMQCEQIVLEIFIDPKGRIRNPTS